MTFYIAGNLLNHNNWAALYPPDGATNLLETPFNLITHQMLSHVPKQMTAIYMYSPLTACVFAPFAWLSPGVSMAVWEMVSLAALFVSARLMHLVTGRSAGSFFWMALLFLPVFHTILIGHLGIALGIMPLALGMYLLLREKPFAAGLAWSLLLLKPQFVPSTLLVVGALALAGKIRSAAGLGLGFALLTAIMYFVLPGGIAVAWLHSFRLSDTLFTDPRYGYPRYLVCSIPGTLIDMTPRDHRQIVKLVTYALAAVIGLFTLWRATMCLRRDTNNITARLPYVFLLSIAVLPLVLPHFVSYDFCIFAIFGMLVFGYRWSAHEFVLKRDCILAWIIANLYLILWMFAPKALAQPLIMVAVSFELYRRLIVYGKDDLTVSRFEAQATATPDIAAA
ncbi:MAG TPA: glycosyltransferase family 87 protein [Planktothrix sp.]